MANNRMYLRCPVCPAAKPFYIAKYYPGTGWYARHPTEGMTEKQLNDWFEEHRHDSQWGSGFVLEFEIEPDFPAPNQPNFTVSPTEPFPLNPTSDS